MYAEYFPRIRGKGAMTENKSQAALPRVTQTAIGDPSKTWSLPRITGHPKLGRLMARDYLGA
jgi:hypothetical protein